MLGANEARDLLKRCRGICLGCNKVNDVFVDDFLRETKNTHDMRTYSALLSKSIDSIQKKEEDNAGFSLFEFGGFIILFRQTRQ